MNWPLVLLVVLYFTGAWNIIGQDNQDRLAEAVAGKITVAATASPSASPAVSLSPSIINPAAVPAAPNIAFTVMPNKVADSALRLSAAGAFAADVATGTTLFDKAADAQLHIASVTKLVTAITFLSRHDPTERVTVPVLPGYPADAELVGLAPGETYSAGDLIRAALIASGNDAADALAIIDRGSVSAFADAMNAKMTEWSVTGTHFTNASGLSDYDNYATPRALAKIAMLALKSPFIKETISHQSAVITSGAGRAITLNTTNKLLATGNFYGIKTGYTGAAGQCFVGLTKIQGHEVITVILGSADRFGESQRLTDWINSNYKWF